MKTRIFIFIVIFTMLIGCINDSIPKNSFTIRVRTGFKERTGKDYIECWINDSLVFRGLYVNKTDDQILDYHDDWLGMKIASFNKNEYDSIKVKIRVTSLDTVLYCGKKMIDSTFKYRIDSIPSIVIACDTDFGIILVDTLKMPDYFWLEY